MPAKINVLYISYDGMTDPLGQSQVLSYLKILSQYEFSFHVLSYEKQERYEQHRSFVEDFIRGYDITWHTLPYTNTPPLISTAKNIRNGKRKIKELDSRYHFGIVHCRGYIAAIMGEWLKKKRGTKFIFDMRGWWPDEKKEAGDWLSAMYRPVYRYFKQRERGFFRHSDLSISLTHAGKQHIVNNRLKEEDKVDVIPTCVNFDVFPAYDPALGTKVRQELQLPAQSPVMIYSGSLGGNYRGDIMLRFFRHLLSRRPDAFFLFITHSAPELVEKEISNSGIAKEKFRRVAASYAEVHRYLAAGDIGIIMYNTGFSVIGRSPTKLGEYWACGLKALSAKGIGDLDFLVKKYPGGGALADKMDDDDAMKNAVDQVLDMATTREALRDCAIDYFDLEKGCNRYLDNYRKLVNQ